LREKGAGSLKSQKNRSRRPNIIALVPSAGSGRRFGGGKTFFSIKGKAVLLWALEALERTPEIDLIIPIVRKTDIKHAQRLIDRARLKKVAAIAAGGKERQDSVWNGLKLLPSDTGIVLVHDGARPFAGASFISGLISSLKKFDGVVPGLMPKDTTKEIGEDGLVCETLVRENLVAVQTPQVFPYEVLCRAYEMAMRAGYYATDDAALVESMGGKIKVVPGSPRNIKITTREDIITAERFFK